MSELPPAPVAGFRPKNGAVLATGILLGLTGMMMVGTGFLTFIQTFAMQQIAKADPKAMSELAGMQDMMRTASFINLVFYGGLGALFLSVAYGCITYRRWARPFALTLGWGWVFMGITMLISLSVMMGGLKDLMSRSIEQAAKTSPNEAAMPAMDGIFTVIMVIYFLVILVFLIALPAVILWLQWGEDVRRTLEFRDPKARWTDRQPAPLIGMTIAAALFAACSVPYLFLMQSPLMKAFLPEGPLKYLWLLVPFVWAYVAWGSYRRQIAAWIVAVLALVTGVWFGFSAMSGTDWAVFFKQMGIPEKDLEDLTKMTAELYTPSRIGVLMIGSMIPIFGYLIWVLRYFRRAKS
jgi:NADH:ubiquinone oxidoreductase subunit 3 (subunit A)